MLKQKENEENLHLTVAPAIAIDRAWSNYSGGSPYCSRESRTEWQQFCRNTKKYQILDQKKQFSMGNFHFLAAEKPLLGGGDFKTVRAVVLVVHDAIVTRLLREKWYPAQVALQVRLAITHEKAARNVVCRPRASGLLHTRQTNRVTAQWWCWHGGWRGICVALHSLVRFCKASLYSERRSARRREVHLGRRLPLSSAPEPWGLP